MLELLLFLVDLLLFWIMVIQFVASRFVKMSSIAITITTIGFIAVAVVAIVVNIRRGNFETDDLSYADEDDEEDDDDEDESEEYFFEEDLIKQQHPPHIQGVPLGTPLFLSKSTFLQKKIKKGIDNPKNKM